MKKIVATACAGVLLGAPLAATTGGPAVAGTTTAPPLTLTMPSVVDAYQYQNKAYLDTGPTLRTAGDALEIWAKRSSYKQPIVATWRSAAGDKVLPEGSMQDFSGLSKFLWISVTDSAGKVVATRSLDYCLNGYGQRVVPEGAPRSPYPEGCATNPFGLGSVQGIPAGWGMQSYLDNAVLHLKPGTYTMRTIVTKSYRSFFGMPLSAGSATSALKVIKDGGEGARRARTTPTRTPSRRTAPQPAATAPTGRQGVAADVPKPDLRSLPAWGIGVTGGGNYLGFGATVWNAGPSPLVVDGFRRSGEQVMDAYQYFFDTAGNQVGYQDVGTMEWDPRPSHQHWHFEDFARYRLLNADRTLARRSQKEAFCLANTDAVDYTVPGAAWKPDGTDLSTACGDLDSPAVREELSSGSGDTYSQIRAGQSFNLKGLPNGYYYISVEANPYGKLVEGSTTNNDSLRKVLIGGSLNHRTVHVFKVGLVDDRGISFGDEY